MQWGKMLRLTVAVMLISGLMLGTAWAAEGNVFKDVKSGVWYEKSVSEMQAKGIIAGSTNEQGEKVFKPNDPVTVQESLVFFGRLFNWDNSGTDTGELANSHKVASWAKGYVVAAVSDDVLTGIDLFVDPSRAASRYEVAIFAVRALGLDDTARGRSGVTLDFSDASEIPPRAVGYIDVAMEQGVLSGSDGAFKPNDNITRAEMAAVLARLDKKVDVDRDNMIKAKFIGYGSFDNSITVRDADRQFVKYTLSDGALIYRNGVSIALEDLEPLEYLGISLNHNDEATYVEVIPEEEVVQEPEEIEVSGKVADIDADIPSITIEKDNGQEVSYEVAEEADVLLDWQTASLEDLVAGQSVEATVKGDLVETLFAGSIEETIEGIVVKVDFGSKNSIVIDLEDGSEASYLIDEDVDLDGDAESLRDIYAGQEIEVELKNKVVVNIDVTSVKEDIEGSVEKIILAANPEIVVSVDGEERSFTLAKDVDIEKGGDDATINDVKIGDYVELKTTGNVITAMDITAKETSDYIIGEIENINTDAEVIILKDINKPIYLTDDTVILRFGHETRLRYLDPKDEVIAVGQMSSGILEATTIIVISTTN